MGRSFLARGQHHLDMTDPGLDFDNISSTYHMAPFALISTWRPAETLGHSGIASGFPAINANAIASAPAHKWPDVTLKTTQLRRLEPEISKYCFVAQEEKKQKPAGTCFVDGQFGLKFRSACTWVRTCHIVGFYKPQAPRTIHGGPLL